MLNSLIPDTEFVETDEETESVENQDVESESAEADSTDGSDAAQEPTIQAEEAVYGSYRIDLNNEDNGWCEATVYENGGNVFVSIAGYINGNHDVADLSGQLDRQEDGTYTVSNLYLYDGEQYLGEDVPENVSVDVVFADACMTVQITNVDGATVSELSGTYELSSDDSASGEEIQRVEEYANWDDITEVTIRLEYIGKNEGYAVFTYAETDENGERTSQEATWYFSLIDESGIYGLTDMKRGATSSLVFTIETETDGVEEYKCLHLTDKSDNTSGEFIETEYAYSHFS